MVKCSVMSRFNNSNLKRPGISFHRFSKNYELRLRWLNILCRPEFKPSKGSIIYTNHFNENDINYRLCRLRLKDNVCPFLSIPDFHQEEAKVVYSNPSYIKDAQVVTGRWGRDDSSYSNLTLTTLMTSGNNVSVAVTLQMVSGGDFRLSHKLCDIMKEVWVVNFLKAHSDLNATCPFLPRTYNMFNIVLPPKNMPIPMIASDYYITLELYMTRSKEQILKVATSLRYEETKWKTF